MNKSKKIQYSTVAAAYPSGSYCENSGYALFFEQLATAAGSMTTD